MKLPTYARTIIKRLVAFLTLFFMLWTAHPAQGKAASIALSRAGRLDAASPQAVQALSAARSMGMDWVILEIDWSALPRPVNGRYDLGALSTTIVRADDAGLRVALSIHSAPAWAMDEDGPNPQATAALVRALVNATPYSIQAIELFPEPNTSAGWGALPNPQAYAAVLRAVHTTLEQDSRNVILVTGGLSPQPAPATGKTLSDLDFLQGLYRAGALADMDAVGLSYPVFDPAADDPEEPDGLFRHYQEVRLLMLNNGHKEGSIWVTRLAWKTDAPENTQDRWLHTAYQLLRQQVYIGLVAFDGLTPPPQRPLTVVDTQGRLTAQFGLIGDAIGGKQATPAPHPFSWSTLMHRLKVLIRDQTIEKSP